MKNTTAERPTKGNGGSKKSRQREQLILALLQQPSLERAGSAIGVSAVTAWRISKTPEFQQEYRQARRESMEQSARRLQQGCGAAVLTLMKIMMDPNSPAASRLRAADSIISHSKSLMELEDIDVRLQRVEKIAASQEENRLGLDRRAA
jgi:hypothetical protein